MMFASKKPSLRLDQSDLKCKNGCEYFGNPQWQGYCSKCHREQMSRQRRAEKATSSTPVSSTLPRPGQTKPEGGVKLASHSSFSKFEEKRLRQSETLKKANILKFSVFKKSSNSEEQDNMEKRQQEFKIPPIVMERMKRDFRARFPNLPHQVDRESRSFVHTMVMDVIKYANVLTVDELSERVQRHYQRFIKHMDTSQYFSNIDADTKELLIDFVEKHAMTYLHDQPSVVFSPAGTDDERLDRAMSDRIQQLSWVGEQHLECKLDRGNAGCRQLLYKAISELLGMDSASNPGGKLRAVRRACRHVLRLCTLHTHTHAAPASADDLLPALIFTVLKANPPRLVSNINFVTRFCNAQRLMTGEGGYYFTNLCCAVSFIENLTADSLNMDKKEFECYMAMPASIGGSAWAAALSLCGAACEAEEQRKLAQTLIQEAQDVTKGAELLQTNAETFEAEIAKKVKDVLAKTPLEITPRRLLPRLAQLRNMSSAELQELKNQVVPTSEGQKPQEKEIEPQLVTIDPVVPTQTISIDSTLDTDKPTDGYMGFDTPPKSPQNLDTTWDLKQTNSLELLTPSPLGFTPFDSRSVDELLTPDEFGADQVAPGLSNINYDIDLSDFSADNSAADDPPKDPFSPEALRKEFDPFAPLPSGSNVLKSFDEFSLVDTRTNVASDPFEVVQSVDTFSSIPQHKQERDPFSPIQNETLSILDGSDSPNSVCLLPSPLQPQSSGKQT